MLAALWAKFLLEVQSAADQHFSLQYPYCCSQPKIALTSRLTILLYSPEKRPSPKLFTFQLHLFSTLKVHHNLFTNTTVVLFLHLPILSSTELFRTFSLPSPRICFLLNLADL